MTSRQAGRRMSTIAAGRRIGTRRRGGSRKAVRRKEEPLSSKERRHFFQLIACGGIFVLLVAVKLLLPDKIEGLNRYLTDSLRKNMDVQAVFSAVGRAFTGESDVGGAAWDVYQAVFHPEESGEALETVYLNVRFSKGTLALDTLRPYRAENEGEASCAAEPETSDGQMEASDLAYVLYSDQNLPERVSLEQTILGFDYCAPVAGTLSSGFGYREHPVEGEERFHYGIDLAADAGANIVCFADGVVTAVGESSSYGKYCIISHGGGYSTLYAHCSRVTASSGAEVSGGEKIAEVGDTGAATGPHLHFELQRNGVYLNPIYYVAAA